MVAYVLRLRLDLLLGTLRGPRRVVVTRLVESVLLVAVTVAVCLGVLALRGAAPDVAATVTVVAGAAITTGFFLAAVVGGLDDQLDPRRFGVVGVSPTPLAATLLLASVISMPVLALIAVGACLVVLWSAQGAPLALALTGAVLGVINTVLISRMGLTLSSLLLRERRTRELTGLFLIAVVIVVVPAVVFLASLHWGGRVPTELQGLADVLAVTPVGAAWAIPGRPDAVAAPLVVAVLTVAALAWAWVALTRRAMTTTERPGYGRDRAGLGWFAITPGTPTGGIAARSLIYWLRDPRYLVNIVVVPIAAAVTVLPLVLVGVPLQTAVLLPAPIMAAFLGWIAHNDLAYDSTALWLHIAGGVRGYADRLGRLVPPLLIGTVLLTIAIPVVVGIHGDWSQLPSAVGVCVSLFLGGLGLSSISSVATPYAVSGPGDSPFQQPQRTGGGLTQAVVLLGTVAVSAPALWWAWQALNGQSGHAWLALWGGVGIGVLVLAAGIAIGGAVFDRRGSSLMDFAASV